MLISTVTDAVMDEAKVWQSRPLDGMYPIVYLDCIHVKSRDAEAVKVKAVYLALGDGQQAVAGLVDCTNGRCQILAAGRDRTQEPWRTGHLHRLRGWLAGLPRSDRVGVSQNRSSIVRGSHGTPQFELRELEDAQGGGG